MSDLLQTMFGKSKPVIAMAHFPALPGTPRYDADRGVDGIIDWVRRDVAHLSKCGVDGILFCNEDDRPYSFHADFDAIAVMTRVISEIRPHNIPFGVDFLWDGKAAIAMATATGAAFMREVITGVYESDMGLWAPDAAALYRYRRSIDGEDVRIFGNITPEFASPLGTRSIRQRARSAVVSSLLDAILISGPMAGAEPGLSWLTEAKEAVGDDVPVLLNTGAQLETIRNYLTVADGVIVGSCLKEEGRTWNPVDPHRVEAFMAAVNQVR